jgi:hypothetical protein
MKKSIFLVFISICICFNAYSQKITHEDIAKSLLNKYETEIYSTLDALGVWYKFHKSITVQFEHKYIFSIENSMKSVKVYVLKTDFDTSIKRSERFLPRKIEYVIINFNHDNKEDLKELDEINNAAEIKIGKYSTDVIYYSGNVK